MADQEQAIHPELDAVAPRAVHTGAEHSTLVRFTLLNWWNRTSIIVMVDGSFSNRVVDVKYQTITLSLTDVKLLQSCIRKEAKALGYGTTYVWWERKNWPSRLKRIGTVARKLGNARANMEGWPIG